MTSTTTTSEMLLHSGTAPDWIRGLVILSPVDRPTRVWRPRKCVHKSDGSGAQVCGQSDRELSRWGLGIEPWLSLDEPPGSDQILVPRCAYEVAIVLIFTAGRICEYAQLRRAEVEG